MFRFEYEVIKIASESLKIYTIPRTEDRQTTYVRVILYQDLLAILGIKFTPQSWQNIRVHCQFEGRLQSISICNSNQSSRFFRVLDLPASIYFAAKSRSSMSWVVYQSLLNVYNSSSDKPNQESINTWLD